MRSKGRLDGGRFLLMTNGKRRGVFPRMNNGVPTFLKWAGGKSQLLEQYGQLFPHRFERYFILFLGSGAVFFYVKKRFGPRQSYLSDSNEELINAFVAVKDEPDRLIESLKERKGLNSKEYFYELRKQNPSELSMMERASRFIYLNKTCYNGLYRVNSHGQFNVPYGVYRNPAIYDEAGLKEASKLLQGSQLKAMRFKGICCVKKGDFIYFDPVIFPDFEDLEFHWIHEGFILGGAATAPGPGLREAR